MDGVEIVIKPIHLERVAYSIVIIVLAVLLVLHWGGSGNAKPESSEEELTGAVAATTNQSNESVNGTQEADLCANGVKDGEETDVDCGGPDCDACAEFKSCNVDSDCESGWCRNNIKCIEPSCEDGVKNQDESNVDCGGVCGGFFYEGECHDEPKPSYSGRVELSITDVDTSENDVSGYAKIDSVDFKVENGKDEDVILTAYLFARDSRGQPYYESSITGEEIPLETINLPLLAQGESHTETVEIGRTLTETEPDDEYQITIELRDDDNDLETKDTWENG